MNSVLHVLTANTPMYLKIKNKIKNKKNKLLKLAVLISGEGTNLQAVINQSKQKKIPAEIKVVISNNSKAGGINKAKIANIPVHVLSLNTYKRIKKSRNAFEKDLAMLIKSYNVDLIVLAGFMLILSGNFIRKFPGRIINLHPSILPENINDKEIMLPDGKTSPVFRGLDAVKAAFKGKATYTGCTVHEVTSEVDKGGVIVKKIIKINKGDTLKSLTKRIHRWEHKILPEALNILAKRMKK